VLLSIAGGSRAADKTSKISSPSQAKENAPAQPAARSTADSSAVPTLGDSLSPIALTAPKHPVVRPMPPPRLHVTWNAPFGDPRARTNLDTNGADTSRVDTLFLSFESPPHNLPLLGLSGALLFEPQAGDTLGSFWAFERTGPNSGNLRVEFDHIWSEYCEMPWNTLVYGHVGYTRAGGRGRLDLSADIVDIGIKNLFPNRSFCFARIAIDHKRAGLLEGCGRPMSISWVGVQFATYNNLVLRPLPGPGQRVTMNASKRGVASRHLIGLQQAWVPPSAPPSRASLPRAAIPPSPPEPADASLPVR